MSCLTIAAREWRSLVHAPMAWIVLAIVQAILGWLFLIQVWGFEQLAPRLLGMAGAPGITVIVVAPVLKTSAMLLMMVTPLITMRLLSEEQRNGTLALLMSAPVSAVEIVIGKFLGALGYFLVVLVSLALLPLSLLTGADLDLGLLAAAFLGLALLSSAYVATGLYVSSLTATPGAAAGGTLGLLLALWVLDAAGTGVSGGALSSLLQYLSFTGHLDALLRGVFDTRDLGYYVLVSVAFLVLTVRRLESMRLVR